LTTETKIDTRTEQSEGEQQLIEALKSGRSFEKLVNLYHKQVINVCYRFTPNNEDAEDTAQEVFIEVYNSVKNFRGDSKLSTWLYRIAVTKSLDLLRKRNAKKSFAFFNFVQRDNLDFLPDCSTPQSELEDNERRKILNKALNSLPDKQQIAITLNKLEFMTNKEIAQVMKLPVTSVDTLIHRAKKSLKEKLQGYYKSYYT